MSNNRDLSDYIALALTLVVTVLGILYLVLVPLGVIKHKLEWTDLAILALLLLISSGFINRLVRLAISGKGIEVHLEQVQKEQREQKAEIESLRFLISFFVTEKELSYLKRLAGLENSHYKNIDDWFQQVFTTEIRRLRALGLIRMRDGWIVANMPKEGDLKDYCEITDRGVEYLKLRGDIEPPA